MDKHSNIITEFDSIQNEFGYLLSLDFSRDFDDFGCTEYNVKVVLCNYPDDKNSKLLLRFTGVKNLKFGDLDGLVKNVIRISDITSHQMEGIRYSVKEEENETFTFYCKSFSYEILQY